MTIYKGYELDAQLVEVMIGLDKILDKAPLGERSPEQARKLLHQRTAYYQSLGARRPDNLDIHDDVVSGSDAQIPVRIYRPKGVEKRLPILLYFHGGAWMRGDLDTHDDLAGRFAGEVCCVVVSVDYRLAPEHKFPAAVEDAYVALLWVSREADKLNIDKNKIALCGDSSGGNIAAALALMTRDQQGPNPIFQLLLYPVLDLSSFETTSYLENGDKGFGLTKDKMIWARELYLEKDEDKLQSYASPLLAPDLVGLSAAKIITAEYDPLRDEGQAYARRLEQAGVDVSYSCYPGMTHGIFDVVGVVDTSRRAMDEVVEALRSVFSEQE